MPNPHIAAHPMLPTFTHGVNLLCKLQGGTQLKKLNQHANLSLQPAMLASFPTGYRLSRVVLGGRGLVSETKYPGFPFSPGRTSVRRATT